MNLGISHPERTACIRAGCMSDCPKGRLSQGTRMRLLLNKWLIATGLALFAPLTAYAQVQASLVAADKSIQLGHPLTVALRLDQQSSWHTYWISAGTGYPTNLKWDLPNGWTAGAIEWPTPTMIRNKDGAVTGNGYTGVVYLPVLLQPPMSERSGERVTLKAHAKWLMCSDICIPGKVDVTLTLPVSKQTPEPEPGVRAELAKMAMPQPTTQDWTVAAARESDHVVLRVSAPRAIASPHFFGEDGFIQYDGAQEPSQGGRALTLSLPVSDDADTATQRLVGVLAYTDADGVYRGQLINASLSSTSLASIKGQDPGNASNSNLSPGTRTGVPDTAPKSLALTLIFALFGGLILNLMPCVFPVLGIKITGFVNQSGQDPRKVAMHGLAFTLGVLLSFWVLAGLLATLRATGSQIGWGFQLQSPVFVFGLTVILLVFGLSLSGVFEAGLRATGVGSALQTRQGYIGSLFAGVLATVVATPCSAPFLAPALGAALTLPTVESTLVFTAIGIGLSAPYLLLSIFPRAINALPRPGRWMETFRQIMAFPLYASAAYLLWVLAGQVSENGLLMALLSLTVIAMAGWLYGRCTAPGATGARVRFGFIGGVALLAAGLSLGWPRAGAPTDITWEPWSVERVEQLRLAGRPIYMDFTARWCATCQANKELVFASSEVKRYFRDHRVATLKADWTNADPNITEELAKWHRSAVPFNLIYPLGDPNPKILPEVLTPGVVLSAFRGKADSASNHHEGS